MRKLFGLDEKKEVNAEAQARLEALEMTLVNVQQPAAQSDKLTAVENTPKNSGGAYAKIATGAALLMMATAAGTYFLTRKFAPGANGPENCPMGEEDSTLTLYYKYQDVHFNATDANASVVMGSVITREIGKWLCSQLLCASGAAAAAMTGAVSRWTLMTCIDVNRTFDNKQTLGDCVAIETAGVVGKAKALCGMLGNRTVKLFKGSGLSGAEVAGAAAYGENISYIDLFDISGVKTTNK